MKWNKMEKKENIFDDIQTWINKSLYMVNAKFEYGSHELFYEKLMDMNIDFRDITFTVFENDNDAQKGFSALLKLSLIAPCEATEACVRLLGDRFSNYRFFILGLFVLYRDYPKYREPIMKKFRFYDDSNNHYKGKINTENKNEKPQNPEKV